MRQIVLDTETTGLETSQGHRIIEIGCVELINRRLTGNNFQRYLNPDRLIDEGALAVHGIDNEFLQDKPAFADIVDEFIEYINDAELIIHNASFDVGFINYELSLLDNLQYKDIKNHCAIIDTLAIARHQHPGQRNSLDALCKRYTVDNSQRQLHGALLDSTILADVYLAMTGGQTALSLADDSSIDGAQSKVTQRKLKVSSNLKVIKATKEDLDLHNAYLKNLDQQSDGQCVWLQSEKNSK